MTVRTETITDREVLRIKAGITDPRAVAFSITGDTAFEVALTTLFLTVENERKAEWMRFSNPQEAEEGGKKIYFAMGIVVPKLRLVS